MTTDDICDGTYPGIEDIKSELTSWQWVYGKTPKFTICHSASNFTIDMLVEKGIIQDITVDSLKTTTVNDSQGGTTPYSSNAQVIALQSLVGLPFCPLTVPMIIRQDKVLRENVFCKEIINLFHQIQS